MNTLELETKIKQIVHSLAYEKGFVCAIDMLLKLEYLSSQDYKSWRFGKVDYLERVCKTNLSKLSLINRTIRKTANELKLEISWTGYHKYGEEPGKKLIFSKSRNNKIEDAYATHYVDKRRLLELKGIKACV